jgi:hypothetical protein
MIREHFRVVYDGPAVEDGEMDVSQFAASLLALGKLIENADAARTGDAGRVKVRIQADVKRGSFDIGIAVHWAEGIAQSALAWAMTPEGAGTLGLLGLVGLNAKDAAILGGRGVIQVVRWLRGRKVTQRVTLIDGNTTLTTDDGEQLTIDSTVARLVDDPSVRQPLERFTEPLREEGVEQIRLEVDAGIPAEVIDRLDAPAFKADASAEPTSTDTFRATYQIKRLFFERGRKWRLSNGAQTIQSEIEDEEFWMKVDASALSFAKEDYLVCVVQMDQWFSASGLRTEYKVTKVDEHIPAPKQRGFDGV